MLFPRMGCCLTLDAVKRSKKARRVAPAPPSGEKKDGANGKMDQKYVAKGGAPMVAEMAR